VQISASEDVLADLPEFVRLHRARWGERGLFTETPKGAEEEAFRRASSCETRVRLDTGMLEATRLRARSHPACFSLCTGCRWPSTRDAASLTSFVVTNRTSTSVARLMRR
jgi:hypothetical protein